MFTTTGNVAASVEDPADSTREPLLVRRIEAATHTAYAETHSASFLQMPDWASVKPSWRSESLGWFDHDVLVGAALVLYRPVPGTRRCLAYVPEGPTLPWTTVSSGPSRWLAPFVEHLRSQGAFDIRIGPSVPVRHWQPATAKRGLADPQVHRFADLAPDEHIPDGGRLVDALWSMGWRPADRDSPDGGFGQPRFGVRLELADRTVPELLARTNVQWRRNVGQAIRAGVVVRGGNVDDLPTFHRLYRETAARDGFTPRPAGYFDGMWRALANGPNPRLRLYLAELGPGREPLAAALVVQVGGIAWYSYGGSTARHREAQAATALQWTAICEARAHGCHTYDLRAVADTLDPEDPLAGLLRFKLGTGGGCEESAGEWELTVSRLWHRAFRFYLWLRS
jgi:lipid II:glycine glycyltransferase (peptidoglycan interpeptide bridge formation enzyme)